jgi:acetylornithine deacetylase/succinyl-diaminopimelate desuccinylase-like protein
MNAQACRADVRWKEDKMVSESNMASIYQRPAELLQRLIRFDTTNPPGNETECIAYIDTLLKETGLETICLAKDPNRPNLITRLKGQGNAPPLLLHGHVDVVTTAGHGHEKRHRHDAFCRLACQGAKPGSCRRYCARYAV